MNQPVPSSETAQMWQWFLKYHLNYEPRSDFWHPILLEEIALNEFAHNRLPVHNTVYNIEAVQSMTEMEIDCWSNAIVPLEPSAGERQQHPEHAQVKSPKFLSGNNEAAHSEMYLG